MITKQSPPPCCYKRKKSVRPNSGFQNRSCILTERPSFNRVILALSLTSFLTSLSFSFFSTEPDRERVCLVNDNSQKKRPQNTLSFLNERLPRLKMTAHSAVVKRINNKLCNEREESHKPIPICWCSNARIKSSQIKCRVCSKPCYKLTARLAVTEAALVTHIFMTAHVRRVFGAHS